MRNNSSKQTIITIAGALLLGVLLYIPGNSYAAGQPRQIDYSTTLPGIPEAGAPSFVFNDGLHSFGGDVQSWFQNYIIIQNVGGANGSYNFFAHNEGAFTFWEQPGVSFAGSSGLFDLTATFDSFGNLQPGGTVQITGAIASLGITDPSTVLMTANLVSFNYQEDLLGFAIDNIVCDAAIIDCAPNLAQQESIYFGVVGDFIGIDNLNGMNYRSTMTNKTTVPIPATAWLMLSGLGCLGFMRKRRKA